MLLVKPSFEILSIMNHSYKQPQLVSAPLLLIEKAGRTCYKSDSSIQTQKTAEKFIQMIMTRGHESVIEHSAMTVKVICDRGVTHEIVRHRIGSYSQESTRYVNYKGGCCFVIPPWCEILPQEFTHVSQIKEPKWWEDYSRSEQIWITSLLKDEYDYKELIGLGWSPQKARSVLPNSTKTEIVITYNFREWRHFFKLRCSHAAHPQMQEIARPLLKQCKELIPVIFDDIILIEKEKQNANKG